MIILSEVVDIDILAVMVGTAEVDIAKVDIAKADIAGDVLVAEGILGAAQSYVLAAVDTAMVDMPVAGIAEVDILAKADKLAVEDIVVVVLRTTKEVEDAWLPTMQLNRSANEGSLAMVASVACLATSAAYLAQSLSIHKLATSSQGLHLVVATMELVPLRS